MEGRLSSEMTTYPKLDVKPLNHSKGPEDVARWHEDVGLALNKIAASVYKHTLVAAIHREEEYVPKLSSLPEYHEKYPTLTDEQLEQIALEESRSFTKDNLRLKEGLPYQFMKPLGLTPSRNYSRIRSEVLGRDQLHRER